MSWNVWNITLGRWENLTSYRSQATAVQFMNEVLVGDPRDGDTPKFEYEVRRVGDTLEQHGTKLMQLKPSMVWRCAMDDIDRRQHNEGVATMNREGMPSFAEHNYKQYAFHRRHVLKASTANDILRAAIAEPGLGLASGKKDTRLLYSDVELLKAALQ